MIETGARQAPECPQPSVLQRLWKFIVNPKIAAVASVCSILSFFCGFLLYRGQQMPALTLRTYQYRAQIVQGRAVSGLRVTLGGQEIKGSVFAAQLAIWNDGDLPIRESDVLSPIRITSSPAARVLEVRVKKVSRSEIAFHAEPGHDNGTVGLRWKVLESRDGGLIEVICEGDSNAAFSLEGAVIGQRTLTSFNERPSAPAPEPEASQATGLSLAVSVVTVALSCLLIASTSDLVRFRFVRVAAPVAFKTLFLAIGFAGVINLVLALLQVYRTLQVRSPFGF